MLNLLPWQRSYHEGSSWLRSCAGGRATGKTTAGAYDLAVRAGRQPGLYLVVTPDMPSLREVVIPRFLEIQEQLVPVRYYRERMQEVKLVSGALILFRHAPVVADKQIRLTLSGVWFDEPGLTEPTDLADILEPQLVKAGPTGPGGWIGATLTPKLLADGTVDVEHWSSRWFLRHADVQVNAAQTRPPGVEETSPP
jgi:hypothetical protein